MKSSQRVQIVHCSGIRAGHCLCKDGKIALQDTGVKYDTQEPFEGIQAHNNANFNIAWMPQELKLITASGKRTACLWDVNSDVKQIPTLYVHTQSLDENCYPWMFERIVSIQHGYCQMHLHLTYLQNLLFMQKAAPSAEPGPSQEFKRNKAKRISGHDYSAWDKFDANKACKEVEGKKEEEEKVLEIPSKEELEKEHEEANKFKDDGNALVKNQEYAKAVGKYSQAIKIFPYDAVFYANRALCHLKLDNLYSSESDCTDAIKRDEHYVKAYHKRATATMELKRHKVALRDIEIVLKLDPGNKEATSMLVQAQKKLENSKQIKPENLPGMFKDSMESNIFSDILSILSTKFVINKDKTYAYLYYLEKVKRFRALILFMTEADKAALKTLFEHCKTKEGKIEEEIKNLSSA